MIVRLITLLVALLIGSGPVLAERHLTLGVFAYRPKAVMEEDWKAFADYLDTALADSGGLRLRVMDQDELQLALQRHELDFVLTNPAHYITLRSDNVLSGSIATIVQLEQGHAVSALGGVIIVRADDTKTQRLEDLRGLTIAIPGKRYLGGYTTQAFELLRAGIDPESLHYEITGQPHDKVVEAVLEGRAQAGFIRSGILERLEREARYPVEQLRVLNAQQLPGFPFQVSTRLYPEWAFVALPNVEERIARRLTALLLSLEPDHPAARSAGIHGFTIPADYAPVEEAMRRLRLPPFDIRPDITLKDIWERFQASVLVLAFAAAAILLLSFRLITGNRRLANAHAHARELAREMGLERDRLSNIIAATRSGTWEWEIPSGKVKFNERWAEIVGYSLSELHPTSIETWISLTHPDDLSRSNALLEQYFAGESTAYEIDVRMRHKDGHWVWVHDRGQLISRDADGKPLLMAGTHQDISERKQAEDALRLSASVFSSSYDGILISDANNRIIDINPAFTRITGYTREEILGKNPGVLSSGKQEEGFYELMWKSLEEKDYWQGEIWNQRKNGEAYVEALSISRVRNEIGALTHHVAVFSDISRLKAHEQELDRIANFDPLTGAPNRRLLADRLRRAIARADRESKPLAVCMLDLDGFKPINDEYGHDVGDALLVEVVVRLQGSLRKVDTVARLGGDEFVLLINSPDSPEVFERILTAICQPIEVGVHCVSITASLGVTYYPEDSSDGDTLLRHAGQAMYHAKQQGRNCIQVFDSGLEHDRRARRARLERIEQAFNNRELVLHYQPQVDMREHRVIGAEALLRWEHPERGLLAPADFLPEIQGTPLEIPLGEWVIDSALEQLESWHQQGLDIGISVNIGAYHLLSPGFVTSLQNVLKRYPDLAPHWLEIEIIESAAIDDMHRALEVLAACRKLGLRLALDDFGTGYASLSYFRNLPIDLIKIDRAFVRDMLDDADDHAIVETVVHLARAFGRNVIAEGVETPQHAIALTELGCRLGQGYGIARPMPAARIPAWLGEYAARSNG